MFEGLARVREAEIAGAGGGLRLLDASPGSEPGAVILHLLDAADRRLVELDWLPGGGFATRAVALGGALPEEADGVSVAGRAMVVAGDGGVRLVDRETGAVRTVAGLGGAAAIDPTGRFIISATDRGLLSVSVWAGTPDKAPQASGIRPLLVEDFQDPRCIGVLPAHEADAFDLAIGCLASVALVMVRDATGNQPWCYTQVSWVDGHLPYDNVILAVPSPVLAPPGARHVYAGDVDGVGLVAVETYNGTVVPAFEGPAGYGRVRAAVPSLDSGACLIAVRPEGVLFWTPGETLRPADWSGALPLAWQGGYALIVSEDGRTVRETPCAP